MAVYGQDGLDEISLSAPTTVCEINDGKFDTYVITPEQFGLTRCQKSDIVGGTPEENAAIARDILSGKLTGPKADIVLLNAGAALHITQGISIQEGIELARQTVASGKALAALEKVIALTNE
jgi:anthranilate phosphoribosyltransferase